MKNSNLTKWIVPVAGCLLLALSACTDVGERNNPMDPGATVFTLIDSADSAIISTKVDTVDTNTRVVTSKLDTLLTSWKIQRTIEMYAIHLIQKTANNEIPYLDTTWNETDTSKVEIVGSRYTDTLKYLAPLTFMFDKSSLSSTGDTLTLSLNNFPDTISVVHLTLAGANVKSAALTKVATNVNVLTSSNTVDVVVLDRKNGFTGSVGIVKVVLAGMVAGTPVTVTELTGHTFDQRTVNATTKPSFTVN